MAFKSKSCFVNSDNKSFLFCAPTMSLVFMLASGSKFRFLWFLEGFDNRLILLFDNSLWFVLGFRQEVMLI